MTELKCSVYTCVHNRESDCELDRIQVGGRDARFAEETSCDSFREQGDGESVNQVKDASPQASIGCEAIECEYNHECHCHANSIHVGGREAVRKRETECETFCC